MLTNSAPMTMRKGQNHNHPKKGSSITVEPIRELKDIKSIKKLLSDKPRDLCLFTLGINTNLRASDLLNITIGQVRNLLKQDGDELHIKEQKTGKPRRITLNKACIKAIHDLLQSHSVDRAAVVVGAGDPLFQGQRGPLTVPSVNRLVKQWCSAVNLKGNYGSHTLRKTWGYHQRKTFCVDIPTLMVCFNHSTQRQTLDYLCIQPQEIKDVYQNEL